MWSTDGVPFDGRPFAVAGRRQLECRFGPMHAKKSLAQVLAIRFCSTSGEKSYMYSVERIATTQFTLISDDCSKLTVYVHMYVRVCVCCVCMCVHVKGFCMLACNTCCCRVTVHLTTLTLDAVGVWCRRHASLAVRQKFSSRKLCTFLHFG